MQIKKGTDVLANKKPSVLLLGKPGTAKTTIMCSAAQCEKLFVISLEKGLMSAIHQNYVYVDVKNWQEFVEALNWLMKNKSKEGYTALGIDSLTKAQTYLGDKLTGAGGGKLTFDGYREMLAKMTKMLDVLTGDGSFALIITCLELGQKDDVSGIIKEQPLLEGQLKGMVHAYFDVVAVTRTDKNPKGEGFVYWCEVSGTERTVAKNRLPHLRGKHIVPSDYKSFVNQ